MSSMNDFQVLPPLSSDEYERLRADIETNGVRDPVDVDEETGAILDGHHRIKAATELGVGWRTRKVSLASDAEREAYAIRVNLNRRHLSSEQRAQVAKRQRELAFRLKDQKPVPSDEEIGRRLGVPRSTVASWFTKNAKASKTSKQKVRRTKLDKSDRQSVLEAVESGQAQVQIAADFGISQQRVSQVAAKEAERRDARETGEAIAQLPASDRLRLIISPIADLAEQIEPGSVDVIITDPPYGGEYLPLLSDLSALAAHALKPGRFYVMMFGQVHWYAAAQLLAEKLEHRWLAWYRTRAGGQKPNIRHLNVQSVGKPLFILTNGPVWPDHPAFLDEVESDANEKDHHEWGQSLSGMSAIVEQFSRPGDLILDPFCGAGTTALAALAAGRRCLAADKDEKQVALTAKRCGGV